MKSVGCNDKGGEVRVWKQKSWAGGPSQQAWDDATRYLCGEHVCGWRGCGELRLDAPSFPVQTISGNMGGSADWVVEGTCGRVYARMGEYWYRSRDSGRCWEPLRDLPLGAGRRIFVGADGTMWLGCEGVTPPRLFISGDAGATWEATEEIPVPDSSYECASAWIEREDHVVFVTSQGGEGHTRYVWKTKNHGRTWCALGAIDTPSKGLGEGRHLIRVGDDLFLGVFREMEDTVRYFGDVYRSSDWGHTWNRVWTTPFDIEVRGARGGRLQLCGEPHVLLGTECGSILIGTHNTGFICRSEDAGEGWALTDHPVGLVPATRVGLVATLVQADDGMIYAGGAHRQGIYRSTNDGKAWEPVSPQPQDFVDSMLQASDGTLYFGGCDRPEGGPHKAKLRKAGFFPCGWLDSSVYDAGGKVEWGRMAWEGECLGGVFIRMKVRTGNDPATTVRAPWDGCPFVENGQDISGLSSVCDGDRYIQYRVEMVSNCALYRSPVLKGVRIEYRA